MNEQKINNLGSRVILIIVIILIATVILNMINARRLADQIEKTQHYLSQIELQDGFYTHP